MSKKDSNILELKLERVIKKRHTSDFNKDLKPIPNHPTSVSQLWSLPPDLVTPDYNISASFGKMYVGESFTSCLKISNISQAVLERVQIACTLKYTNAKSLPLLFQAEIPRLFPDMSNRFAFTLNVDAPDIYYLNLQAHFSIKEITEPVTVAKLFKFEAKKPLEFSSKVTKADEGFIVQTRVINQSIYTATIDTVEFISSGSYKVIPYTVLNELSVFYSSEVRSFLYHLIEITPMPSNNELGRLLITWHNNTGDIGTVPSNAISHSHKYDKTLKITIENKPKYFLLEEPTSINLKFTNLTANFTMEDVKIDMNDSAMNNFVITPLAPTNFARIKPQETQNLLCAVLPKVPGIHKLEGIKIYAGKKMLDFEASMICIKPS
ncbi:hypothetical protein SteCoe_28959 [Stentor coeruleus]|uniref:Trafficking protein particle complex subunit 13 N-terminal domain-containing protein n=1 Tax=Stentor coeruleus TaxID=5963 RepID=A0A1R2B732_9CILI|nr:hypothetical protein SteCoe_28959 [Stentor coeruleus]